MTHLLVGRFCFITKWICFLARILIIKRKSETTHLLTFVNDPNWHIMCLKPTIISTYIFYIEQPHPHLYVYIYLFVWCDGIKKKRGNDLIYSHTYTFHFFFCKEEETHTHTHTHEKKQMAMRLQVQTSK